MLGEDGFQAYMMVGVFGFFALGFALITAWKTVGIVLLSLSMVCLVLYYADDLLNH